MEGNQKSKEINQHQPHSTNNFGIFGQPIQMTPAISSTFDLPSMQMQIFPSQTNLGQFDLHSLKINPSMPSMPIMPNISNPNLSTMQMQMVPMVSNPIKFLNQGYAKEVTSYVEGGSRQKGDIFGGFNTMSGQTQQKKWEPVPRFTKLFTDEKSPWKQAHKLVKNLYTPEQIQNNTFKFPQNLDKCLPVSQNLALNSNNKYIFNCCCHCIHFSYYHCFNCHRILNQDRSGLLYTFGICESCFEPNQHIGHYYKKIYHPIALQKFICICGKDMFQGNPPVYRCSNHRESTEQQQHQEQDNKNQQQWLEILQIFQSLFSIMFYLQRQMYSFEKFQNEQSTFYFESMKKVIGKIIEICKTDGCLMKEIFQFLCNTQVKVVQDHSRKEFQSFLRGFGKNSQSSKIMNYLMVSFQSEESLKQLLLLFLQNNNIAQNFIQRIMSAQKMNMYARFGEKTQLQLKLRSNIAEKSLLKCSRFFRSEENQKIIWLKQQKNYDYALRFIRQTVYPRRQRINYQSQWKEFAQSMLKIVKSFDKIDIGKFLKHVGPLLLPELLNCFRRIYIERQLDYQQQGNQNQQEEKYERECTRKIWENNKDVLFILINRVIISLCNGLENLTNFKTILQKIQSNFVIDEQKIIQSQKKKEKILKVKQITENFLIYYKQYSSFWGSEWDIRILDTNQQIRGIQKEQEFDKYKSTKHLKKLVGLFLSTSFQLEGGPAIDNLCKISQMFGSYDQNLNYRRNHDEAGKKIQRKSVYQAVGLIMFYQFFVPELCYNDLKSEAEVQQYRTNIQELFMHYLISKKTFSPSELHVLNKKLQIHNFSEIVAKHLAYNYEAKQYFYNKVQLPQFPDLPVYQLLWKCSRGYDRLIGRRCAERLDRYIKTDIQKQVLCKIFVKSALIQGHKQFLDRVIANFGQVQGEKHIELVNQYLFYLSYLIVGQVVARVSKNQSLIICDELKKLREDDQYRYRFPMTEQEKGQIDELLFGKREQTSVSQHTMQEVKEIPKQEKQEYISKKGQKNKQFRQKRQKLLSHSGIATETETCMVCRSGPAKENPLIYPMHVNVNKTVPSSFYPEVNKMRTNIKSCFHPLHLACYREKNCSSCPLCSQSNNCFITTKFAKEDEKMNRMCYNSIIVALWNNYKVYDIENLFILLVKYLVEAKVQRHKAIFKYFVQFVQQINLYHLVHSLNFIFSLNKLWLKDNELNIFLSINGNMIFTNSLTYSQQILNYFQKVNFFILIIVQKMPAPCNEVSNILRKVSYSSDMFRAPACLRARGEPEVSRLCPGILSVLIGGLFIAILILKLIELLSYQTITSATSYAVETNMTAPSWKNLAFSLSPAWSDFVDWSKIFAVNAYLTKKTVAGGSIDIPLEVQKCRAEQWKQFNQTYKKFVMTENICIKNPEKVDLYGTNFYLDMQYLTIDIVRCTANNTNHPEGICLTNDTEFNTLMQIVYHNTSNFFGFYFKDTLINAGLKYPLQESLPINYNFRYDGFNRVDVYLYLGSYTVETDTSIWPIVENIQTFTGYYIHEVRTNRIKKSIQKQHRQGEYFGSIIIAMSTNQKKYTRQIGKIDETVSYAGGLFGLILTFFALFVFSYNKFCYELLVAECSFNYEESGEKVRSKYFTFLRYVKFQVYDWLRTTFNKRLDWQDCNQIYETKDEANLFIDVQNLFRRLRIIDLSIQRLLNGPEQKMLYLTESPDLQEVADRRVHLEYYNLIIQNQLAMNIEDLKQENYRPMHFVTKVSSSLNLMLDQNGGFPLASPLELAENRGQEAQQNGKLRKEFKQNLKIQDEFILDAMASFKDLYKDAQQIQLEEEHEKAEINFANSYLSANKQTRTQLLNKIPLKILFRLSQRINKMKQQKQTNKSQEKLGEKNKQELQELLKQKENQKQSQKQSQKKSQNKVPWGMK